MWRWSIGCGFSNHSARSSRNGWSRSHNVGSESGSGTSGMANWCVMPLSSMSWNDASML